jgi:hypothetical protein
MGTALPSSPSSFVTTDCRFYGRAHLSISTLPAAGTTAAAATGSAVAAAASMCSVGELRAGEEGSGPDLTGDNARAVQHVEVLPRTDQRWRMTVAEREE